MRSVGTKDGKAGALSIFYPVDAKYRNFYLILHDNYTVGMHTFCHLSVLINEQARRYGSREAIIYQDFGDKTWKSLSWERFSMSVKAVSNAMLGLQVKPQENIGVFSQNCYQYLLCDYGAWGIRAVTVPLYATSSEQQMQFILNDASIRLLFVGEQEQYDKAQRMFSRCPALEKIIVFDRNVHIASHQTNAVYFDDFLRQGDGLPYQTEVERLYGEAGDKDMANILYTSGTTGDSKGVILTHGQYNAALDANHKCIPLTDKDRVINFLPFAHIFEKAWAVMCLCEGATMIINTYPQDILTSMKETNPTSMSTVPRFWEKVYAAVMDKIERASPLQQRVMRNAIAIGRRHNIDYIGRGLKPPMALHLEYEMIDKTVFSSVRGVLGLSHPHIFPTAGAAITPQIEEFVRSIGINMITGYGLTESLATVSCTLQDRPFTIGSVGYPIEGLDIKIGDNNEILLKGPTITPGYYNRKDYNKTAFDEDGFFHTGDAGYMKDGELFLTERIKDLFKTSNGKYIAPQMIETTLLVDKYIDQIAVIADMHQFVSALIIPDYRLLEEYARDNGIDYKSREDLCADKRINRMIMERIETLQQQLTHYEQVKRFTLLPRTFSMERGELTDTLKLRRRVVCENYKTEIDKMYEES